jgi:hypothetical protein
MYSARRRANRSFALSFVLIAAALGLAAPAALAAPDYDGDGVTTGDCKPLDPAVNPGAVDRPDLGFEDLNCDGIDGDASKAYFVSPTGSNTSAGTRTAPLASIQTAVTQAAASATRKQVYVATGDYNEHVVVPTDGDGIGIYGGYVGGTWQRTAGPAATRIAGSAAKPEALLLNGATQIVVQSVTGHAVTDISRSAYGLRAINSSEVALVGSDFSAESGSAGAPGSSPVCCPVRPPKAEDGKQGINCDTPGVGGNAASGGNRTGGAGGAGGEETNDGENGQFGLIGESGGFSGPPGGLGGAGGIDKNGDPSDPDFAAMRGVDGQPGATGVAGTDGAAGPINAGSTWAVTTAGSGGEGGSGSAGGGGGGGAGRGALTEWAAGPGGGQGGHGGTGGAAGGGGTTGGGSFGVYTSNSKVVVLGGSSLTAGNGAAGGAGGNNTGGAQGGEPGKGASPRTDCRKTAGAGGDGGAGGSGGRGGHGGGAPGGPSVALYRATGAVTTVKPGQTLAHGSGGSGGVGPADAGDGAPGDAANEAGTPNGVADYDSDGITDASDTCPEVARGATDPDGDGCPNRPAALVDSDGDGVPDNADTCPSTAAGANDQDGDGCPDPVAPADSDHDGVPDPQDACPTTPAGTNDQNHDGCPDPVAPADSDGDGIADDKDACPTTPAGAADANQDGCPDQPVTPKQDGDADGDGVPDARDRCPTVAAATSDGCPAVVIPAVVDTTAPSLPGFKAAKQKAVKAKALAFTAACSEDCTYQAVATIGRKSLGTAKGTLKSGAPTPLKLKLGKSGLATLKKALKKKKTAAVTLTFTLVDAAGNKGTVKKSVTVSR